MALSALRRPDDLPETLPVFPLAGCILLPRAKLPLNIFEPRYLAMVDACLAGDRLLGIVQPASEAGSGTQPALRRVGCVGRITAFSETDDNRYLITVTGIARVELGVEAATDTTFRRFAVAGVPFAGDFVAGFGEQNVDWPTVLQAMRRYFEARDIETDWDLVERTSPEQLINTLSIISPYDADEKQALLEAPTLRERSEILMTLAEIELAGATAPAPSSLQ